MTDPVGEPATDPASDSAPVLVVGGGVAGLVAARDLAIGGRRAVVLEASDRLGGQLAPLALGGVVTDAAAESFATRGGAVAALAAELGLGGDVVTPLESPAWVMRADGTTATLPATSVLGIPGVPMASDVIAAIGLGAAFRAQLDALMPGTVGAKAETIGELVRIRMGRGVAEGLLAPIARGVHSAEPDALPVDRAVPGLRAALRHENSLAHAVRSLRERAPAGSQVAGIRGGVHRLADALVADLRARGVELRTGARVVAVRPDGVTLADGEALAGEPLIATAAVAVDPDAPPRATRGIAIVTLLVDAPGLDAAPRGTGVLVASGAPGVKARALTHSSAKWAWLGEAAAGRHVVRLSYDRMPGGAAAGADDGDDDASATPTATADAVAVARRDAEAITGARIREVIASDARVWTRTLPAAERTPGAPTTAAAQADATPADATPADATPADATPADATPADAEASPIQTAGEAASVTGLAAVVTSAREAAGRILATGRTSEAPR